MSNHPSTVETEDEELEDEFALNTSLSLPLVRGTEEPTMVDKGGWLKLYKKVNP